MTVAGTEEHDRTVRVERGLGYRSCRRSGCLVNFCEMRIVLICFEAPSL